MTDSFYDFNIYVELDNLWSTIQPEEYKDLKTSLDMIRNLFENSLENYANADDEFKLALRILFNSFKRSVESLLAILRGSTNCNPSFYDTKYYLGGPVNVLGSPLLDASGKPVLDSVVLKITDTVKYPNSKNCPNIYVLVPKRKSNNEYDFLSGYDATEGVLKTTINMELLDGHTLNANDPNLPDIIKSIITNIIGQSNITEFTMTGETSGEILSSKPPSQPPSTYGYGSYKNLKTAITDKNIKLTLKIHNPTQTNKITHLLNVPQTYSNSYAQKDTNYIKI
jgi:hypothetical protein